MVAARFTVRQLDAFVAAAELSNFTQVANRLNLSPSAVSSLISELEAAVGFSLFDRTTRKVALTQDGREFLPAALAVLRQFQLAGVAANDVRNRSTEVVRVAAPLVAAAALLPAVIVEHRKRRERATVRIIDTGVEWLADGVATGAVDLAIGPDRLVGADVVREPLCENAWVVWCAPAHPLARQPVVRWQDLQSADFYAAGRDHEHSVRPRLTDVPEAFGIEPVQVVDNITTALGIAAAGLGFTCSPSYVGALAEGMGLVCRRLVEPEIMRSICLYRPSDRPATQAVADFVETIRTMSATWPVGATAPPG